VVGCREYSEVGGQKTEDRSQNTEYRIISDSSSFPFKIRCWTLDVRCSSFNVEICQMPGSERTQGRIIMFGSSIKRR